MTAYKWGTIPYKVPAQAVGEHLEHLDKQYGEITTQIMVDDARPAEALMHPLYEWDDFKAAEKWRNTQAGKILSNLIICKVGVKNEDSETKVRAFHSVKARNETGSYRPLEVVMSDESTREVVLENARTELRSFTLKYQGLVDIAELFRETLESLKNAQSA